MTNIPDYRFSLSPDGKVYDAQNEESYDLDELKISLDGRTVTLGQLKKEGDVRAQTIATKVFESFCKRVQVQGVKKAVKGRYLVDTRFQLTPTGMVLDTKEGSTYPLKLKMKDGTQLTLEELQNKGHPQLEKIKKEVFSSFLKRVHKDSVEHATKGRYGVNTKSNSRSASDAAVRQVVQRAATQRQLNVPALASDGAQVQFDASATAQALDELPPTISNYPNIRHVYATSSETLGSEVITRRNSVADVKKMADAKIAELTKLPKSDARDEKIARMERLKIAAGNHEAKTQRNWINSQFWRDILEDELEPYLGDKAKCLEVYRELCEDFMPASVNLRGQVWNMSGQETRHLMRCGILTDLRNNLTHLSELEAIRDGDTAARSEFHKRVADLQKGKKTASKMKTNGVQAGVAYAQEQVAPANIDKAIADRTEALETQMLQLLAGHVESNPELVKKLAAKGRVPMMHVGLVREVAAAVRKDCPWVQHELNELEDTRRIFEMFDGKTLVFDGTGPYIDEEGKVHLPLRDKNEQGEAREAKLETYVTNVSVQSGTSKQQKASQVPRQGELNTAAEKRLKSQGLMNDSLEAGFEVAREISNFDAATKLAHGGVSAGMLTSVSCQQGKDRTGCVCEGVGLYNLREALQDRSAKERAEILREQGGRVLLPGGPAAKVTQDNTGVRLLKIDPFQRPEFRSKAAHVAYVVRQAVAEYLTGALLYRRSKHEKIRAQHRALLDRYGNLDRNMQHSHYLRSSTISQLESLYQQVQENPKDKKAVKIYEEFAETFGEALSHVERQSQRSNG